MILIIKKKSFQKLSWDTNKADLFLMVIKPKLRIYQENTNKDLKTINLNLIRICKDLFKIHLSSPSNPMHPELISNNNLSHSSLR